VLDIQRLLPNARVVYASATGATEPRNMAYMTRLGLWGSERPFPEFKDFITAVEKRGIGAMEIVAMDMKVCACNACCVAGLFAATRSVFGAPVVVSRSVIPY
jgi:hypothetical protein